MDQPLVVTYDNKPTENTKFFLQTLENNKWNYKLIGEGETWQGFTSKLNGYANFIKTLDPTQLIIVSDARDVVCLRGPKAFKKGFESFNKDLVVSMETTCCGLFTPKPESKCVQCVHLTEYWKYNSVTNLPDRKYVNSGLVAGKAAAVLDWLEWSITNKYNDDQYALGSYINAFPQKIGADVHAILLHTSTFGINAGIQSIHIQKNDSPTFAELFGRGAFFLHISGVGGLGQGCIYEYVKLMLTAGANNDRISRLYKYNEPDWDEVF